MKSISIYPNSLTWRAPRGGIMFSKKNKHKFGSIFRHKNAIKNRIQEHFFPIKTYFDYPPDTSFDRTLSIEESRRRAEKILEDKRIEERERKNLYLGKPILHGKQSYIFGHLRQRDIPFKYHDLFEVRGYSTNGLNEKVVGHIGDYFTSRLSKTVVGHISRIIYKKIGNIMLSLNENLARNRSSFLLSELSQWGSAWDIPGSINIAIEHHYLLNKIKCLLKIEFKSIYEAFQSMTEEQAKVDSSIYQLWKERSTNPFLKE
jgi:hypothetical protein